MKTNPMFLARSFLIIITWTNELIAKNKRRVVGGFAEFSYYSSSQDNNISAWYHNFVDGMQGKVLKNIKRRVRVVRSF
jgi:hypothetical protein